MTNIINDNVVQRLGLTSYDMSISINQAQRSFRELLKTCLGHHGLTIPQWTLLGKLYACGSMRPIYAAEFLNVKPPYIARLINELELQKLIVANVLPDDGRGKTIALTDGGKDFVERVEVMLQDCINGQLAGLQQADLATYFALTEYIAQNVHHHG